MVEGLLAFCDGDYLDSISELQCIHNVGKIIPLNQQMLDLLIVMKPISGRREFISGDSLLSFQYNVANPIFINPLLIWQ